MKKTIIILLSVLLVVLAWCPWLSEEDIKNNVSFNKNYIQQNQNTTTKPEMHIMWVPFGRWVTTVEGGWFVTFWGSVIG